MAMPETENVILRLLTPRIPFFVKNSTHIFRTTRLSTYYLLERADVGKVRLTLTN